MTINQKLTNPKASPTNYKLMVQPLSNPTGLLELGSSLYPNQTFPKLNPTTEIAPQSWTTGWKLHAASLNYYYYHCCWCCCLCWFCLLGQDLKSSIRISLIRLIWREEEKTSTNLQKFAPLNGFKTKWWNQSRLSVHKCSVLFCFFFKLVLLLLICCCNSVSLPVLARSPLLKRSVMSMVLTW